MGSSSRLVRADEAPDARDARVVLDLGMARVDFLRFDQFVAQLVGVEDHAAELDHVEMCAVFADARRGVEDRPFAFEPDRQRDQPADQQQNGRRPARSAIRSSARLNRRLLALNGT